MSSDVRIPGLGPGTVPPKRNPPMELTHSLRNYPYASYTDSRHSGERSARCDLFIWQARGELPLVLAVEREDNPSTSITNMAEGLATQVWQELLKEPRYGEGLRWVEHYPEKPRSSLLPAILRAEKFERIEFAIADGSGRHLRHPHWQHITRAHVEAWVGGPLPPSMGW